MPNTTIKGVNNTMKNKINSTPIQDESGILCFSLNTFADTDKCKDVCFKLNTSEIIDRGEDVCISLENHKYSLNVNVEDERERVKREVNSHSKHLYDWFKEDTGNKHWVLYDTEMYLVKYDSAGQWRYLNYREENALIQMDGALGQNSHIIGNSAGTLNAFPTIPINATSCRKMFYGCKSLENINLSRFDTKNIVTMCCMFMNCKNLKQLDLSRFSTGNVREMTHMFFRCSSLKQVNLSGLDTHNVEYMGQMFYGCESLKQLDLNSFNTEKVFYMGEMFSNCKSLKQLDLSNFNTEKVVIMQYMFNDCSALEQLNISNFDTKCTSFMDGMFWGCTRLSDLDISSFDMEEKIGTRGMFGYCNALKHLKVNHSFSLVSEMYLPKEVKIIVVSNITTKGVNNIMNTEIHFNNVEDAIDTVMKDPSCIGISDVSELVDKAAESNEAITKPINTSEVVDVSGLFKDDISSDNTSDKLSKLNLF